ncbi:MAG: ribonuclease P protein component 1 [Candidatus Bathyarchaeia archaeon]
MKITSDIIRGEFIGMEGKITKCTNPYHVGLKGRIINETKNTFTIVHSGKPKKIIKDLAVFQFRYPDGAIVEIEGKLLIGRPEDRLKKTIKRLW